MIIKYIAYLFATGFGTGYTPFAPGTAGSLLALLLFWFIPLNSLHWLILCSIFIVIGIWAATVVEKDRGKDPGVVVIDEIAGQWCALLFFPRSFGIYIAGFFIFRILDIVKPYPARRSEKLPGGIGIMIDDIIAGIYSNIIIHIFVYFWH
jgi:phosphatidylglycerophosphatase A